MGGFCVTEGTLNGRGKPCPVLRLSTQLQQVNGVSNTIGSMGGGSAGCGLPQQGPGTPGTGSGVSNKHLSPLPRHTQALYEAACHLPCICPPPVKVIHRGAPRAASEQPGVKTHILS